MEICICVSEISKIFFFVCFVVVLVGGPNATTSLRKSIFQFGKHTVYTLLVVDVVYERLAEHPPHDL